MSSVSKGRNSRGELEKSLIKLLRRIAQINTLPKNSRKIHDIIAFEDEKNRYVAYSIVLEVTGDKGSWVLVNRDEPLWNEIVAKLCDLNPKTFSVRHVNKMVTDFVGKFMAKEWRLSGIVKDAKALVSSIVDATGETNRVFLPIWGLVIDVPSFVVGDVEFMPRTKDVVVDERLRKHESARNEPEISVVNTVAVTQTTGGDTHMIVQNAEAKVNQALNILRAFVYPTIADPAMKQIGIMGIFYTLPKLYFVESVSIGGGKPSGKFSGGELSGIRAVTINQYVTEVVLAKSGFDKLSKFLVSKTSEFEQSLLRSAGWLGEATKPDTLESKFIKVALAVDAMLGEEASENIPDKGIRARIAERSAFLLATEGKWREKIYHEMRDFIGKRNKLAHGVAIRLSQWETETFGAYARTILERLLSRDPAFKSTEELAKWVQNASFRG